MFIYFFQNDECEIDYCNDRIYLLDIKPGFGLKKSPLILFEIAFSDICIFLTPKGMGYTSVCVEKKIIVGC